MFNNVIIVLFAEIVGIIIGLIIDSCFLKFKNLKLTSFLKKHRKEIIIIIVLIILLFVPTITYFIGKVIKSINPAYSFMGIGKETWLSFYSDIMVTVMTIATIVSSILIVRFETRKEKYENIALYFKDIDDKETSDIKDCYSDLLCYYNNIYTKNKILDLLDIFKYEEAERLLTNDIMTLNNINNNIIIKTDIRNICFYNVPTKLFEKYLDIKEKVTEDINTITKCNEEFYKAVEEEIKMMRNNDFNENQLKIIDNKIEEEEVKLSIFKSEDNKEKIENQQKKIKKLLSLKRKTKLKMNAEKEFTIVREKTDEKYKNLKKTYESFNLKLIIDLKSYIDIRKSINSENYQNNLNV